MAIRREYGATRSKYERVTNVTKNAKKEARQEKTITQAYALFNVCAGYPYIVNRF